VVKLYYFRYVSYVRIIHKDCLNGGILWIRRTEQAKASEENDDDITTSRDLHEQMNRENEREGKTTIPAINATMGTSSNNLARRDHFWSSVPDFSLK